MTVGTTRGEIRKAVISPVSGSLPLTKAIAAPNPESVAITIVSDAALRLVNDAAIQSGRVKKLLNQWSENPGGGKVRKGALLKARSRTTRIGNVRKSKTL